MARLGSARHGEAGTARLGGAWQGRRGKAWRGAAGQGAARQGRLGAEMAENGNQQELI